MPLLGPEGRKQLLATGRVATAGLELGFSVALGLAIGWGLDRTFHTSPWIGVVGICFGFAAGIRSVYLAAKDVKKRLEVKDPNAKELPLDQPFDSDQSAYFSDPDTDSQSDEDSTQAPRNNRDLN